AAAQHHDREHAADQAAHESANAPAAPPGWWGRRRFGRATGTARTVGRGQRLSGGKGTCHGVPGYGPFRERPPPTRAIADIRLRQVCPGIISHARGRRAAASISSTI